MLHIKYREEPYEGSHIEILPDREEEIPVLRNMLKSNFEVINPAITFAREERKGELAHLSREEKEERAKLYGILEKAWELSPDEPGESRMNVVRLLGRLMQMYLDAKKEIEDMFCYDLDYEVGEEGEIILSCKSDEDGDQEGESDDDET